MIIIIIIIPGVQDRLGHSCLLSRGSHWSRCALCCTCLRSSDLSDYTFSCHPWNRSGLSNQLATIFTFSAKTSSLFNLSHIMAWWRPIFKQLRDS